MKLYIRENAISMASTSAGIPILLSINISVTAAVMPFNVCPEGNDESNGIITIRLTVSSIWHGLNLSTIFFIIRLPTIKLKSSAESICKPPRRYFFEIQSTTPITIHNAPAFPRVDKSAITLSKRGVLIL